MITNGEISQYKVLRSIDLNEAFYDPDYNFGRNENIIYMFGEERFHLALGPHCISSFLSELKFEGFTRINNETGQYTLTERGMEMLKKLTDKRQASHPEILRAA